MTDLPTRLRTLAGGLTELAMSIWQLSSPGSELLVSDSATALLQAADALTLLSDTLSGAIKRARAAESKLDIAYSEQAKQLTQITAIRAKLAEAETARAEALRVRDRSDHYALAERARAEKAEAEAAALRDVLTHYADDNYFGVNYVYATEARAALSQPGPGAALLERVKKLEAVAEAARIDLNTIATMPWNRDDHGHPQWTGLRDPLWSEWIHGTHATLEEALAALEQKP